MSRHFRIDVATQSDVSEARRVAASITQSAGFDETDAGKAAIVATEAGSNLVKHAGGGMMILRSCDRDGIGGIEMLAIDKGPGHANIERSMEDGYSTAGTSGNGLGAIARLSAEHDIYSGVGQGTVLRAVLWAGRAPVPPKEGFEIGVISTPKKSEFMCGDAFVVDTRADSGTFMVADGLGHGPAASDAAQQAVRAFLENTDRPPAYILETAHDFMRPTRGGCAAVAKIDVAERKAYYCGVGNIVGMLVSHGKQRHMASLNGTIGQGSIKCNEFTYDWLPQDVLVLHSDGLSGRWNMEKYPGLTARHPLLIAAVLYRDNCRNNDDATILVARLR